MLVKIAGMVVINSKGNAVGVVQMDIVAKMENLEMDVMGHLVVLTSMLVLLVSWLSKGAYTFIHKVSTDDSRSMPFFDMI